MMYTSTYSQRGALIQMTWMTKATMVQVHMPAMMEFLQNGASAKETGVYVPAMSRKMFMWSMRRSTSVTRGDQSPRW